MKIGVFGGTFNPPHEGHKKLALEFMSRLSLDLLLIVPTYIPPHKLSDFLADGADRLEMCRLTFLPLGEKVSVSDMELRRHGKSYTVDTLRELKERYPKDELLFLMGSDMLLSFHKWRESDKILDFAVVCAAPRDSSGVRELEEYVERHYPNRKGRFLIMDFSPIEISSTEVRDSFDETKVEKDVAAYIKKRGLYT